MRRIDNLIVHCSDSTWGDREEICKWHRERGYSEIGYHATIANGFRRNSRVYVPADDGVIKYGRAIEKPGAHVVGHNAHSMGVCLIGKPEKGIATYTPAQMLALLHVLETWLREFKLSAKAIKGHREFPSGSAKDCPGFDVSILRRHFASRSP